MANFEFYSGKTVEMKHRLRWIKQSLGKVNPVHNELKNWITKFISHFQSEIDLIEKLIRKADPNYLPRVKNIHIKLEN